MLGNTKLIEHGIFTEDASVLRAHVSISAGKVYFFTSEAARIAINNKCGRTVTAAQDGIMTSRGVAVSIASIAGLKEYAIPNCYLGRAREHNPKNTGQSQKGRIAVRIMGHMLKSGIIPIGVDVHEITDKTMQIMGYDIIVGGVKIQVKCDWNAGTPGTGNVYLETHECNPFKRY